jgi:hypothetical protein
MPRTRIKPPTIFIHGRDVPMSGNQTDGYLLRIDELFTARVKCSPLTCGTVAIVRCSKLDVFCREVKGYHEQAAANAVSRWFRDRTRKWGYGAPLPAGRSL